MKRLLGVMALCVACNGAATKPPPRPAAPVPTAAPSAGPAAADPLAMKVVDPVAKGMTVAGVREICDEHLGLAKEQIAAVRGAGESAGWEATFGRLDDAILSIGNASEFPDLMGVVHPDKTVREAAQDCEKKTDALLTSIWLDAELAGVLQAFAASPGAAGLSPERKRFVEHVLRDFRRNGLELDAAAQARMRKINEEATTLSQDFIKAISESAGSIEVTKAQLAGLSDDYVAKHPADAKGKIRITTDYPDYLPFVKYALDRKAARELHVLFDNRGGERNVQRLDALLGLRNEKAQMLGYATWADYAIEPRMAKNAAQVTAFLDRVSASIKPAVDAELKEFRAEWARVRVKGGAKMTAPDRLFLTELIKDKRYKFDSKVLTEYFEIGAVTRGLLDITARMYGLEYKKVNDAAWHPSVGVYEVWSGKKRIGKFYLDLHPREAKYKHAAMFVVRSAKTLASGERQTPMASLVCNFPEPGQPMPHDQVVTYFHEFGHVLHHLLTETELAYFSGTSTARDFVEAPSQMFEEWAWSRDVLDLFARHKSTGEKIPDALFTAMTSARRYGNALHTERQVWLSRLDLAYHTRTPPFDTTEVLKEISDKHFSFAYIPGTHFQSSFGHLIGYDAGYYGYQWALSLAYDVLGRFKAEGLFNTKTAGDWRKSVLALGGSRDERELIHAFLGRDPSEQAYADYLMGK